MKEEINSISIDKNQSLDRPFTRQMFCKGIIDSFEQKEEYYEIHNFIHIRKIVNFLFDYRNWQSGSFRETTIASLDEDPILHTFAYFIQSNADFCYNWSYLIGKLEKYLEFLTDFQSHIDYMVNDVEIICNNIRVPWNGIQLVLEGYVTLFLKDEKPYYSIEFAPQEFHRLIMSKKGKYHLTLKFHKATVGNFERFIKSDALHIANQINILLHNSKNYQDEGKDHTGE